MKTLVLITILVLIFACNSHKQINFNKIDCSPEEMPKYDGPVVSILDENGIAIKDTVFETIEKRRSVFKPCRDYIYLAKYYDQDKKLITSTHIKMTATGKRWEYQPDIQDEVVIQYKYLKSDETNAAPFVLNKTFPKYEWTNETKTGIIENVEKIWMHPFRDNQFTFTEVAPFPEIRYPLEIGRSWTGQLNIQEGWGDWANTYGYFDYKITSKESIKTPYGVSDECWKVESIAEYPFGKSRFDYWFHETLGFVKMEYVNYGNQTLSIELQEVNDK